MPLHNMIPTVISDDGKKRVIRYSLKNKPKNAVTREPQVVKRTAEFVNYEGLNEENVPIRITKTENSYTSRVKSQFLHPTRVNYQNQESEQVKFSRPGGQQFIMNHKQQNPLVKSAKSIFY